MDRLKHKAGLLAGRVVTLARGAGAALRSSGRVVRIALSVAWITVMLVGAFTVFRFTYGRPWFSAPASLVQHPAEAEDLEDGEPAGTAADVDPGELETSEHDGPGPSRGDLLWPVGGPGSVEVGYGLVTCPTLRRPVNHHGIDIGAEAGTPVAAAYEGTVIDVRADRSMGNTVVLSHGDGILTVYASLEEIRVWVGQRIERGQVLGTVGRSALAEAAVGPHLHFEVRVGDTPVNPKPWLGGK